MFDLTRGAIEAIMLGKSCEKPVLQLISYKNVSAGKSKDERYRLLLSDGVHSSSSALIASQLGSMITSGELDNNAIFRVETFVSNQVTADKRIMVITDLTVLHKASEVGHKIGDPQSITSSLASKTSPALSTELKSSASMNAESNKNTLNDSILKHVYPIAALSPYQNKWTIKARVSNKSNIRTWSNSRGEGKLFSVDLLDDSGEIRMTFFNEQADKFYNSVIIDKIYLISKCALKTANKQYSNLKNDYEMTANNETIVCPCSDETQDDVPEISYSFVPISDLFNHSKDDIVDVMGIVKSCSDLQTIITKSTRKEISKRDIVIFDRSLSSTSLTLWGDQAKEFNSSPDESNIVVVRGARVSDFSGRSLSVLNNSAFLVNPTNIKEVCNLKGWYDFEGKNAQISSISVSNGGVSSGSNSWNYLEHLNVINVSLDSKPLYFNAKASVVFLKKENCMYKACPLPECNKKILDLNNGMYKCEKCDKEFDKFKYRFILQMNLCDATANQWVTSFTEVAELILGCDAEKIGSLREEKPEEFDNIFQEAQFKSFIFTLRAKGEIYNLVNPDLRQIWKTKNPDSETWYTARAQVYQLKSFYNLQDFANSYLKMSVRVGSSEGFSSFPLPIKLDKSDEQKMKIIVQSAKEINYDEYCSKLIEMIEK